jgi:hypothetical protein
MVRPDWFETIPVVLRTPCGDALNGISTACDNGKLGFETMNDVVRFQKLFRIGAAPAGGDAALTLRWIAPLARLMVCPDASPIQNRRKFRREQCETVHQLWITQ